MDKQRFPRHFMWLITALGLGVLLFSVYRISASNLGIPFLILAYIGVTIASRPGHTVANDRFALPLTESLAFLSILVFDGEAAVLIAAATAVCVALRFRKETDFLIFYAAFSAISTAAVVWTVRTILGPIPKLLDNPFRMQFIYLLLAGALIQAVFQGTLVLIGEAYKIKQGRWQTLSAIYPWLLVLNLAGTAAAGIAGVWITVVGLNAASFIALVVAIVAGICGKYFGRVEKVEDDSAQQSLVLHDNSERFRSAFDHAAIGMALVSSEGRWLQVNRSLCGILGYTEVELIQTDFLKITHPDDLALATTNIKQLLKGRIATHQMEKRYIHKQGHEVWVLWSVSLARDAHTQTPHLIFQVQDITDRKRAEDRLMHDAFHDALTGLPNRALFMDHLKLAIAHSKRRMDYLFAVLYMDLDRFKIINDSLGHMIGDQLLVGIAKRLENCLRPGDTIARLGGDEFTILLEDVTDEQDVAFVAERIQEELTLPFNLGGRDVFTTVSIGIAISSSGYDKPEDILRDSDTAMYRAKTLGKARHEVFDKAMHAQALKILQIETDLRRAVERQEFFIDYQPIVTLETGKLRGFEALVRWRHPERGLISPADFVPIAEETGLIGQIGAWVLREACRQMNRWNLLYPTDPPLVMSVNLSGKQFAQSNLIGEVANILEETDLPPDCLKLEITESVVMENIETATEMLQQLRALGLKLSIDDFGTGYSSLSYLHKFPIDTLKIDRSFVTQMAENNENAEIVRTIVVLAQNLGMDVVAEGVETTEQCQLLNALRCENGQGYLFSRPVNAATAEKFVADAYEGIAMLPLLVQVDVMGEIAA
jgi:diguanylate cyclase (GGDEF)-like protein/PAS domain S-box-containing protein